MGAVTITQTSLTVFGNKRISLGTMSFSTSYATGGDTVSVNQMGLSNLDLLLYENQRSGLLFEYNYTTNAMRAMYPQGTNAPGGTGIGTMTFSSIAPTGAVAMTASSAWPTLFGMMTAGQGLEVQNTANLSTITIRYVGIGS